MSISRSQLFVLTLLFVTPCILLADTISQLTAVLSSDRSFIKVELTLDDVSIRSLQQQKEKEKAWEKIGEIRLNNYLVGRKGSKEDSDNRYIWQPADDSPPHIKETPKTSGKKGQIFFRFHIFDNPDSAVMPIRKLFAEAEEKEKEIRLSVRSGNAEPSSVDVLIFQGIPLKAPEFSVTPEHQSLRIRWKGGQSVPHSTPTGQETNFVPDELLVMQFDATDRHIALKAVRFGKEDLTEIDCYYEGSQQECIQCPDAEGMPFSILPDQDQDSPATFRILKNNEQSSAISLPATADEQYIVAMQYVNGIKQSLCIPGKAIRTLTMTEANGEAAGELQDVRCFIATAVYGSPQHPYTRAFRWGRDTFLMPSKAGQKLVRFYYEKSPQWASAIADSSLMKKLFRMILFIPAVILMGLQQASWQAWGPYLPGLFLLTALAAAMIYRRRKERSRR